MFFYLRLLIVPVVHTNVSYMYLFIYSNTEGIVVVVIV